MSWNVARVDSSNGTVARNRMHSGVLVGVMKGLIDLISESIVDPLRSMVGLPITLKSGEKILKVPSKLIVDASQVVLITGAGSGLGQACAVEFAKCGAGNVVLVDRDSRGLEATLKLLGLDSQPESAHYITAKGTKVFTSVVDLVDSASIKQFLSYDAGRGGPFTTLVLNAGTLTPELVRTKAGLDLMVHLHCVGNYQLVKGLLEQGLMKGRIVYVSSEAHRGSQLPEDGRPLLEAREFGVSGAYERYGYSKLLGLIWLSELWRREGGNGSVSAAIGMCPGAMRSRIAHDRIGVVLGYALGLLQRLFPSPKVSARTVVMLATVDQHSLEQDDRVLYYHFGRIKRAHASVYDLGAGVRLHTELEAVQ